MDGRTASFRAFGGRFVIALVVGSLIMAAAVVGVNREIGAKIDSIPKVKVNTAPLPPNGANYLVVGSDSREALTDDLEQEAFGPTTSVDGKRSDTIMVIHVEPKAERTLIVSFPRDLWVHIPEHGDAKINAAYNYGHQTVIDTLKANFDIDINYYVDVDFKSFVEIVDTLGNVPVYVPYAARDENTGLGLPNGGCWPLDGEKSLQWVRSRSLQYEDPTRPGRWVTANAVPDIGRIERQQDFIRRLAGIAIGKSLSNPLLANQVASKIIDNKNLHVDDSFDKTSVFKLLDAFRTINPDDQSSLEFQTMYWKTGPKQGQQDVLYADMDQAGPLIERLRSFNGKAKPQPAPSTIRVRVVNASGEPELAVSVTKRLKELGFATVEPVETSTERVPGIEVRVSTENQAKGKLLLRYIEPTAQLASASASDVDVTLVVGAAFARGKGTIVVPADAQPATTTTATGEPTDDAPVVEEPLTPALGSQQVVLPNPAPRGNC